MLQPLLNIQKFTNPNCDNAIQGTDAESGGDRLRELVEKLRVAASENVETKRALEYARLEVVERGGLDARLAQELSPQVTRLFTHSWNPTQT